MEIGGLTQIQSFQHIQFKVKKLFVGLPQVHFASANSFLGCRQLDLGKKTCLSGSLEFDLPQRTLHQALPSLICLSVHYASPPKVWIASKNMFVSMCGDVHGWCEPSIVQPVVAKAFVREGLSKVGIRGDFSFAIFSLHGRQRKVEVLF